MAIGTMDMLTMVLILSLFNLVLSRDISASNFNQLFQREMTQRHHHCSDWIEVIDHYIISNMDLLHTDRTSTFIRADFSNNQTPSERQYNPGPIRLHMPCSLISLNLAKAAVQSESSALASWRAVSKNLPSHRQHVYHLIWLSSDYEGLSNVTSKLVTLPNTFILLQRDDQVTILTRNLNPNLWYEAGIYKTKMTELSLSIQELDFQGSPVVATVCVVCEDNIVEYKKNGIWGDKFPATIFMLTTDLNGTLEPEGVFGLPRDGPNEDGEWDDFVQPTIEGTAVFATIVRTSPKNQHIIYRSDALEHNSVVFTTARPKRVHYGVVQKLIQPLSSTLWWAILICILAVIASVEILIHSRIETSPPRIYMEEVIFVRSLVPTSAFGMIRKQPAGREKHEHVNTIHAILEPVVDQSGLRSRSFCQNIHHDSIRIVVGLWFLVVIVLNTAYKSMVTSLIVRPTYSSPPTTFSELLASNYHIGCVFFEGSIEVNLKIFNTSMSHQLRQRIQSYSYIEPDCYRMVLESESACVSYRTVFEILGIRSTVNVHYQNIATYSNEHLFPSFQSMGTSLHYPAVVDPLNRYIGAFTAFGVTEKWQTNGKWIQLKKGQRNAKLFAKDKSYYQDHDDPLHESSGEALQMFIQLIGFGIILAVGGFLFECLYFGTSLCVSNLNELIKR